MQQYMLRSIDVSEPQSPWLRLALAANAVLKPINQGCAFRKDWAAKHRKDGGKIRYSIGQEHCGVGQGMSGPL